MLTYKAPLRDLRFAYYELFDGAGLALSFAAREGMTAERNAAVLEVAGHGGLTARGVPANQEAGEVPGRVIAREHRVERSGGRHRPGGAAVQQPPHRAKDESQEAKRSAVQLNTTTPRATWPPRIAAKPSLISSSV